MDYNWLENVPSSVTPIPVYQPDFGFLQSMQMRANMQYEKGLSDIKSTYSSLFNSPVTGQDATVRQRDYAKQAQDQMKDISSSDLSDPKNEQAADKILQPFYDDKGLVGNIAYTREIGQNVQKIQSGLFSRDDKERAMYDPIQLQDQEGYRSDLAEAGVDPDKLAKLNRRPVTPFHDIRSYLNDAAGKQGLQINWDQISPDGQHIITTTNGQRALGDFKTFARTVLSDPSLQSQFQTYGRVARDNAKRYVMQNNPGITPDQMNKQIADHTIKEMDRNYQYHIADYTTQSAGLQQQLDDIKAKASVIDKKTGLPKPTDAMYETYMNVLNYKNTIDQAGKNLSNEYSLFTLNKTSKYDAVVADPTDFFAKLQMNNVVENYSAEKASQEGRKITTNQAYFDALTDRRENRRITNEREAEIARENEFKVTHKYDKPNFELEGYKEGVQWDQSLNNGSGGWSAIPGWVNPKTGKTAAGAAGAANIQGGTVNKDATGFLHVPDQFDKYNADINSTLTQAEAIYWGAKDGLVSSLVDSPISVNGVSTKLSIADADLTKEALGKKAIDPNYKYTAAEQKALMNVGAAIGCTDYDSPDKMVSALEGKVSSNEKNGDSTPTMKSNDLANKKANADNLIQSALAKRKELDALVNTNILSKPDDNKTLLTDDKKRVLGSKDFEDLVSQTLGTITLTDGTVITPEQIGKAYYDGSFDYARNFTRYAGMLAGMPNESKHLKYIKLGDRIIHMNDIQSISGVPGSDNPTNLYNVADKALYHFRKVMEDRFGESKDFAAKRRDITNSVVSQVPGFRDASGERGVNISYNDNTPIQQDTKNAISTSLSFQANRNADGIYGDDGENFSAARIKSLDAILKDPDNYIQSAEFKSFGGKNGKPVVELTFKPEFKTGDKTSVAGEGIGDLAKESRIRVEVDPNTTDPVLQNLMQSSSLGSYADMRTSRDPIYGSNTIQKAHGFDAHIAPSNFVNGKATEFTIVGTANLIDPNTGKLTPVKVGKYNTEGAFTEFYSGEFGKMTPMQIMQMINDAYSKFYAQNINNYRIYKTKDSHAPTFEEIEKQQQSQ